MLLFWRSCFRFINLDLVTVGTFCFNYSRVSKAPWVRKIGNPSYWQNLVMMSPYERTSVRPYRLWGRGGESRGSPNWGAEVFHPFLTGLLKKRKLISVCCQQTIVEVDLTYLRWGCTEAKRKKIVIKITTERQAVVTKNWDRQERACQCQGRRSNSTEQCSDL